MRDRPGARAAELASRLCFYTRAYAHPAYPHARAEKKGLGKRIALARAGSLSVSMNNIKANRAFDNNQLLTKECYVNDDVAT